jgi:hypothetical protein
VRPGGCEVKDIKPIPLSLHGKDADVETLILAITATYGEDGVPESHINNIVMAYDRAKTRLACYSLAIKGMAGVRWSDAAQDVVLVRDEEAVERVRGVILEYKKAIAEGN